MCREKVLPQIDFQSIPERDSFEKLSQDLVRKVTASFDDHIFGYLSNNLKNLGYTFLAKSELIDFIKERVTVIQLGVYGREARLDYVGNEDRGIFIGSWSTKLEFGQTGGLVTVTLGGY